MSDVPFRFEPLNATHDRTAFACGVEPLDRYLQRQARQDMDRGIAAVTLMIATTSSTIAGYSTLSAASVQTTDLPIDVTRKLPGYPYLPAMLIGRLAVDQRFQGQGLGELLLVNALVTARNLTDRIGAIAVIVDAKDDRARSFYERMGFHRLASNPDRLVMSMQTIARL